MANGHQEVEQKGQSATRPAKAYIEPFDAAMMEVYRAAPRWRVYRRLVEKAAKAGDDRAAYAMATWYLHGHEQVGVRKNFRSARRWLERGARSMALAMLDLASANERGVLGLPEDAGAAYALYVRAAEFGSVCARHEVGRCLFYGIGVAQNRRVAERWFDKAAALGYREPRTLRDPTAHAGHAGE